MLNEHLQFKYSQPPRIHTQILWQVIENKWCRVISIKGLSGSQGSLLLPTGSDLAERMLVY